MAKKTSTQSGKSSRSIKTKTSKKTTRKTSKKTSKKVGKKSTAAKSVKKTSKKTTRKTAKTGGKKVAKKPTRSSKTPSKVKPANEDFAAEAIVIKSPLSKKELKYYRDLLVVRRAEILGDITSMSTEALRADASNLSNMPLHMADVGSDQYEQELTLGLVESERRLIQEINDALSRIAEGTYGVCHKTGKRINKARLNAKPWAKYCIEAARELERRGYNNHRR